MWPKTSFWSLSWWQTRYNKLAKVAEKRNVKRKGEFHYVLRFTFYETGTFMTELMPETAETTPTVTNAPLPEAEFDALESLIRLLVGGSIEAPAELIARLKQWEALAAQQQETAAASPTSAQFRYARRDLAIPPEPFQAASPTSAQFRYALVGLIFETHDQVRKGTSHLGRLVNASARAFLRTARPVTSSRALQPLHNQYDEWVAKGETAVNQWIERGRAEEPQSRLIARAALGRTIDEVIEHLAENPEVRELIQSQGTTIAGEMVDGVRARTVTADYLLERLARGLLKRPPREQLPAPASEVMAQASDFHSTE
jgi:hypothetical protein